MSYEKIVKFLLVILLLALCFSAYLGYSAFRALGRANNTIMEDTLWKQNTTNIINIHSQNIGEIVKFLNANATNTK